MSLNKKQTNKLTKKPTKPKPTQPKRNSTIVAKSARNGVRTGRFPKVIGSGKSSLNCSISNGTVKTSARCDTTGFFISDRERYVKSFTTFLVVKRC